MAKRTRPVSKTPNQSEQQPSAQDKSARYALYGTLGGALLSALAQIAVAWIQRH